MVDKFVEIRPKYVRLIGAAGESTSTLVTIIPMQKHSFKITGISAMKGRAIKVCLSEKTFPEGDGYELLVNNQKTDQGRYRDVLSLKTDSTVQPVIKVSIYGNISKPDTDQKSTDSSE